MIEETIKNFLADNYGYEGQDLIDDLLGLLDDDLEILRTEAYDNSWSDGYDQGTNDQVDSNSSALEDYYSDGYSEGYSEGLHEGENLGYQKRLDEEEEVKESIE